MRMAEHARASVLLVGDIDRGGVYASFLGTWMTFTAAERRLLTGYIVNRFRGDASLLGPAHEYMLNHTGTPVLGTIPYIRDLNIPEEDMAGFSWGHTDCGEKKAGTCLLYTSISRSIPAPILTLGLPEEDYERENNLITASDVRAVILSRLRLPAWGTLWDIGAGSGSVGLEAAGLRPNLNVVGIERKPERGAIIKRNRARLGVSNYKMCIRDR